MGKPKRERQTEDGKDFRERKRIGKTETTRESGINNERKQRDWERQMEK